MTKAKPNIQRRVAHLIDGIGQPVTTFCKNVGIGRSTYYCWVQGNYKMGSDKLSEIDKYLSALHI